MVCIYCGQKLKVYNSRNQRRDNQVWRRRKCLTCNTKYSTLEKIDLGNSIMVKNTAGTLTKFKRDKLFLSILKSTGHRADAITDAAALTDSIIQYILKYSNSGIIQSGLIIESAVKVLNNFDKAAVVQYTAYHPAG